jgi:hypothetical protein
MSAWSSLVKAVSKLFGSGGSAAATASTTKVAGEAIQAGAKTVITWGNAFKVAVAGGFTYLFLNGGASNVVASTLGISQDAAQILIIFGFILMMVLILRYIVNYLRAHHGLIREFLEPPIIQNTRNHYWNEEERRWERR